MTKKAPAAPRKKPPTQQSSENVDLTLLPSLTQQRLHFEDKPIALTREALLLNYRPYDVVKADKNPMRRGLTILAFILLILLVARGLEALLGFASTPRFDILATQVLERVTALDWYSAQAAANPQFADQFNLAYDSVWQLIRLVGGYPSAVGTLSSLLWTIVSLLLGWLLYGAVAHLFARWFGGRATFKEFLGPLALSFAPMLLMGLGFIPGFEIAATFVFLFMLVTKFLAVRRTYQLSPTYSLVVVLAPYIAGIALVAVIGAIGLGVGFGQLPYIDPVLRFFTG